LLPRKSASAADPPTRQRSTLSMSRPWITTCSP
jgi:hypothetical protein